MSTYPRTKRREKGHVGIEVQIPTPLLRAIDERLPEGESRSAWICRAITEALYGDA